MRQYLHHHLYLVSALIVAAVMFAAAPALAHHSFSTEFDDQDCGEFSGTLVDLDWQNPHAYFHVERKAANGAMEKLTFQTSSLSNMTRGGTGRRVFVENMGKTVTVRGCAARDRTTHMYAASWLRFPDGIIRRVGQDVEGFFESNN